jgi:hypothetical protein
MNTNLFRNIKLPLLGRGLGGGFLLLLWLGGGCVLFAQNGVTVSNLVVDAGTVTFNVSWDKNTMPEALWSDTVWVFVDYNNGGTMERLPLSAGATLTATSAPGVGSVKEEPDNTQGVWVVGDARTNTSFSATVQLLTTTADLAGACAYASNYPPVGKYVSATEISFTGTPDYKVILEKNDKSTYTATVGKGESLSIPSGEAILSFTDKTGAPGITNCTPSAAQQLIVSAAVYCAGSGITFALANTETGAIYQLYAADVPLDGATLIGGGSPATFSGSYGVGTYSAQTIPGGAFCPAVMTGMHEISENPLPTITHSGDNAIQSANQNMAMTAITYTASYAATISMTGSFPTGVSGDADGSSYSISGTPTAPGTFGYSLTATADGCISAAAAGTITVNAAPPGLYSASTWSIGGYTWSDRVVAKPSGCSLCSLFTTNTASPPKEYQIKSDSGVERYYYNWTCALSVCPSGWSVPSPTQYDKLMNAITGETLLDLWGAGGVVDGCCYRGHHDDAAKLWTDAARAANSAWSLYYMVGRLMYSEDARTDGMQVRCVK